MEPLTPKQTASIAKIVYRVRETEIAEIPDIQNDNPFLVLSAKAFTGTSGCELLHKGYRFGYVAKGSGPRGNEALIAIRGTATIPDWLTDFTISHEEGPSGDQVHAGFARTFKSFIHEIDKSLNAIGPSGVHVIGHSLGGALANLTADYLCQKGLAVKVYSFGAPRAVINGVKLSQKLGDQNIYRVYHTADPVSMVPIFPFQPLPTTNWGHFIQWNGAVAAAPHLMGNYLSSVGEMQWTGLTAHTVTTNGWWQKQTRDWLEGAIPSDHYFTMGAATALWMIVYALEKVVDSIKITSNCSLIAGFTVLDRLAQLLYTGTLQSHKIAGEVRKIMEGILSFVGRTVDKTVTLSVAFIKWVLETLHRVVSTAALAAVCATFRH